MRTDAMSGSETKTCNDIKREQGKQAGDQSLFLLLILATLSEEANLFGPLG
jgi:hypothetical protein